MKRRHFLTQVSALPLSLPILSALQSCTSSATADNASADEQAPSIKFEIAESTIDQLQNGMATGEITSRTLVQWYLNRIAEIDKAGPKLNSVIEINPDAVSIAEAMDKERREGKVRGPLHGIPVLLKDNIDTADKMMTTAGSLALAGNIASKDAFIVRELRKSGAVILGKTNLSEWANFRSTRSSSGWSSRGGQTKNPYVLDRSPCGSSSGSGTAVAANLCTLAIGTETNGSIACPSSMNGIVGIKPTVGLWSRSGIIPISNTQDTAGPMARTVRDAAVLLGALAVHDENDAAVIHQRQAEQDYTKFLDQDGLEGKVIGVDKLLMKGHEAIDALLKNALDTMKARGATIVEVDLMSKMKDVDADEFEFLKYEFKDGLNKYLQKANGKVSSLQQLIDFNIRNEGKTMPFFKQEILVDSQAKEGVSSWEYFHLFQKVVGTTRKHIDALFSKNKLDALCGPTNGPSWCVDLVNGDFFTGYGMYSPAAIAGYPSITVPMGQVLAMPVGITFIGLAWQEPTLISIAYAYEQVSRKRQPPKFKMTV